MLLFYPEISRACKKQLDNFTPYNFLIEIKETTDSTESASYLDLFLEIDQEGKLVSVIYDKRDDFNFPIVNFPYLCGNIPDTPP